MKPALFIFYLLLVFLSFPALAQKEASVWEVGYNRRLIFRGDSVAAEQGNVDWIFNAILCDEAGNLLLYTDGSTIWNGTLGICGLVV